MKTLREEGDYPGSEASFRRFILTSQKRGIIEAITERHSRRKVVYLTRNGERQIGVEKSSIAVNGETFNHDRLLAVVAKNFLDFDCVEDVVLEHDLIRGKRVGEIKGYVPDAVIYMTRGKKKLTIALELELTLKDKKRYLDKARYYKDSAIYDYALYYFYSTGVYKSHKTEISKTLGDKTLEKILLAKNTKLFDPDYDFLETSIFYQNEEVLIGEVF